MRGTPTITPRIRILAATLRAARQDAHFGLRELARRLDINPSLLAHWERGTRTPTSGDVAQILGALGVPRDRKGHMLDLAHGTTDPAWIIPGPPTSPQHFAAEFAHLSAASAVTIWSPLLIPSLLQIPDYARAAVGNTLRTTDAQARYISRLTERRNEQLVRTPVPIHVYLGVNASKETIDNDETMLRQLRFLAGVEATTSSMILRIVPTGHGFHASFAGAFSLFTITHGEAVAHCEAHAATIFLTDTDDLYKEATIKLDRIALSSRDSIEFIADCITQLELEVRGNFQRNSDDSVEDLTNFPSDIA
ncbi:helix-turn-helix domain-containing protein [Amycolatopsis sp. NPDC004368]